MIVAEGIEVEEELIALQEWGAFTARVLFRKTSLDTERISTIMNQAVSVMNTLIAGSRAYQTRIGKPCAVTIGNLRCALRYQQLLMRTIEEAKTKGILSLCIHLSHRRELLAPPTRLLGFILGKKRWRHCLSLVWTVWW